MQHLIDSLMSWGLRHKEFLKRLPLLSNAARYMHRKVGARNTATPGITLLAGWHDPEMSAGESYRWTAKKAAIKLNLQGRQFKFLIIDARSNLETGRQRLLVSLTGKQHAVEYGLVQGRREYVVPVPEECVGQVELEVDQVIPPEDKGGDARELGLLVYEMRLADQDNAWIAKPPRILGVLSGSRCNFECVMCPHGAGRIKAMDFPAKWVPQLISVAKQCQSVSLHGIGEPLLSPSFWKLLQSLPATPPIASFNSNMSLLDDEKIEVILASPVQIINASLDAATPETYRRIRNFDFGRVLANIRQLIARRNDAGRQFPKVFLNMTLMQLNIEEAPQFVELAASLGADEVFLWHLNDNASHDWTIERDGFRFVYEEQKLKHTPEKSNRLLRAALEQGRRLGIPVIKDTNRDFFFPEQSDAAFRPNIPIAQTGAPRTKGAMCSPIPTPHEANNATPQCCSNQNEACSTDSSVPPVEQARRAQLRDCPYAWREMTVFTDGGVAFCCFQKPFASLADGRSLLDIWNSPAACKIREQLAANQLPSECRDSGCIYSAHSVEI